MLPLLFEQRGLIPAFSEPVRKSGPVCRRRRGLSALLLCVGDFLRLP